MLTPQSVLGFIALLGLVVTVHELGHFLAAKWAGVKVLRFSVGFGPKMVGFTSGETEYQIAWIPLGGYVRMEGELAEDEGVSAEPSRSLMSAPWWKRAVISAAGPAMNLALPIVAYFFVFLGDHQGYAARVADVEPGYPAALAGIEPGDLITRIDDEPILEWSEISVAVMDRVDQEVRVTLLRDGAERVVTLKPAKHVEHDARGRSQRGLLGISPFANPPIIGVLPGSSAEVAGLRTFDRILAVNGRPIGDELELGRVLGGLGPGAEVVVEYVRSRLFEVGGATLVDARLGTARLSTQEGRGYAALGGEPAELYVWTVAPASPAAQVGLSRGDRLLAVDGAPLASALGTLAKLSDLGTTPFKLRWRVGLDEKEAPVAQEVRKLRDSFRNRVDLPELGAILPLAAMTGSDLLAAVPKREMIHLHLGPLEALRAAAKEVPRAIGMVAGAIGGLLVGQASFNQAGSVGSLFVATAVAVEQGLTVYLQLLAIVSVNLGLVNLLPIPILDGFSLLSALWEGIRRRAIPARAKEVANLVGLAMLAVLFLVIVIRNELPKFFPDTFQW
jgi:regulator of sigma E protease